MTDQKVALVVTSIASPNDALRRLAAGARQNGIEFVIVGDVSSPTTFELENCEFLSIDDQLASGLEFAAACPQKHYARKNVGYLFAIRNGADVILETDDDNLPYADKFFSKFERMANAPFLETHGWVNVYRYFTDANIWPRGLRLDAIHSDIPDLEGLSTAVADCPIQQGLADDDPDVDAIYRLVDGGSVTFSSDRRVALKNGWCPFNSQSTRWWRDAFPLMYLPAYCSFRMTDIWRSFIAQRICRENGWGVLFHEPHVRQERNDHDLLKDLEDEVVGYLNNGRLCETLDDLALAPGRDNLSDNMRRCYEALVGTAIMQPQELDLLEVWLSELSRLMAEPR
jgi:hypothetical protein